MVVGTQQLPVAPLASPSSRTSVELLDSDDDFDDLPSPPAPAATSGVRRPKPTLTTGWTHAATYPADDVCVGRAIPAALHSSPLLTQPLPAMPISPATGPHPIAATPIPPATGPHLPVAPSSSSLLVARSAPVLFVDERRFVDLQPFLDRPSFEAARRTTFLTRPRAMAQVEEERRSGISWRAFGVLTTVLLGVVFAASFGVGRVLVTNPAFAAVVR